MGVVERSRCNPACSLADQIGLGAVAARVTASAREVSDAAVGRPEAPRVTVRVLVAMGAGVAVPGGEVVGAACPSAVRSPASAVPRGLQAGLVALVGLVDRDLATILPVGVAVPPPRLALDPLALARDARPLGHVGELRAIERRADALALPVALRARDA